MMLAVVFWGRSRRLSTPTDSLFRFGSDRVHPVAAAWMEQHENCEAQRAAPQRRLTSLQAAACSASVRLRRTRPTRSRRRPGRVGPRPAPAELCRPGAGSGAPPVPAAGSAAARRLGLQTGRVCVRVRLAAVSHQRRHQHRRPGARLSDGPLHLHMIGAGVTRPPGPGMKQHENCEAQRAAPQRRLTSLQAAACAARASV
ncbi:uncharacterized protein LOC122376373 [Amphibalanus amphitrite]|uniref:uncharacterized protein LOC122376373 n=1 Tax=Amphibalanus amphitrite TaxID=1232801 RepID=UPI001C92890B|nr:uncharacterized protein LOC122376373 [Amphibalanus amphitrite]